MRILSLFILAAVSSVPAQQSQPAPIVRLIAAPDAKSPPALVSPVAVRQLPNGTLLTNDTQRRQVLLFDRDLRTFTIVADSAGGAKNSYGA